MTLVVIAVGMLGLLAIGMEVAFAIGAVAIAGLYITGGAVELNSVGEIFFNTSTNFVLTAIPLFVLLGTILFRTDLSRPMFDAGVKWTDWIPGGPLIGTMGGVALFSAISGSSTACAATFGTVAIPELVDKRKFDRRLVFGTIASGATLDIMIPPSLAMIIYASLTDQSVGQLFAAGLIPGIVLTALFCGYIVYTAIRHPDRTPRSVEHVSWGDRLRSLVDLIPAFGLIILVLGGIYWGIMTPTESAAIGCIGAIGVVALQGKLTIRNLSAALVDATRITSMVMLIVSASLLLSHLIARERIGIELSEKIAALEVSKWVVLAIVLLMYLILGAFMDSVSMMVITLPFVFPIITTLGFDPIWFGIIVVLVVEIGLIHPPIGMNLFVIHGLRPGAPFKDVALGSLPFIGILLVGLLLMVAVPELATWLPQALYPQTVSGP